MFVDCRKMKSLRKLVATSVVISSCFLLGQGCGKVDSNEAKNSPGDQRDRIEPVGRRPPEENERKADLVDRLRKNFPARSGIRLSQTAPFNKEMQKHLFNTIVEVSHDRKTWRVLWGQTQQAVNYNYVVFEDLISHDQTIQYMSPGDSESGISDFEPSRDLGSWPVLFPGTLKEKGAGRLKRLELLFGMIQYKCSLIDLHSHDFLENCKLTTDGDFEVLKHLESGALFRFGKQQNVVSITIPELNDDPKFCFDWSLTPTGERFPDGGLKSFNVKRSNSDSTGIWFKDAKIEKLDPKVKLNEFKFANVSDGTKVSVIGDSLKKHHFIYSQGRAKKLTFPLLRSKQNR